MCSLFSSLADGPTGIRLEISPPSKFIINKVVKEDPHMLLVNELQSIAHPDKYHKRSAPPPATRLQSSRTSVVWVTESARDFYNSSPTTRYLLSSRSREYSQTTTNSSATCVSLLPCTFYLQSETCTLAVALKRPPCSQMPQHNTSEIPLGCYLLS